MSFKCRHEEHVPVSQLSIATVGARLSCLLLSKRPPVMRHGGRSPLSPGSRTVLNEMLELCVTQSVHISLASYAEQDTKEMTPRVLRLPGPMDHRGGAMSQRST